MIVASLLLILVAVALLVLGLANGSSQLLIGSIGASLLAAIALVIGARQASAARAADRERADGERDAGAAERARAATRERVVAGGWAGPRTGSADAPTESFPAVAPAQGVPEREMMRPATGPSAPPPPGMPPPGMSPPPAMPPPPGMPPPPEVPGPPPMGAGQQDAGDVVEDEEDPPDEPARQQVSPADAAKVARLPTSVMVIDGRPRYHLAGCVHLLGRDGEPLPVNEAVELGFTPCSLCEPDTALLADVR